MHCRILICAECTAAALGFHAIKSESTILDFLGGLNYTHETYSNGAVITAGRRCLRRLFRMA